MPASAAAGPGQAVRPFAPVESAPGAKEAAPTWSFASTPIQRSLDPEYVGKPGPQKYMSSYLGMEVRVIEELEGPLGAKWLLLEAGQELLHERWIYEPKMGSLIEERCSPWITSESVARRRVEVEEEYRTLQYREFQENPEFAHPKKVAGVKQIQEALERGLTEKWPEKAGTDFVGRVTRSYKVVLGALDTEQGIEPTPDLHKKINETNALLDRVDPQDKHVMRASQALAEVEHVANVHGSSDLAMPMVLGAQGPEWSPEQKDPIKAEEQHGDLPPLDIVRLEADAYYQTTDGTLHIDEVKDTPRALADKVKKGDQIRRQIAWLEYPSCIEVSPYVLPKQVGYFARAPGPYFDEVLSEDVIANFQLLERKQSNRDESFLRVGDVRFSARELAQMYDDAIDWLGKSRTHYQKRRLKASEAATQYFGNVETALATLEKGPLPWNQ